MKYEENEQHKSQSGDDIQDRPGITQVPSSLLSNVLHRLGLAPEEASIDITVDDLLAQLKSDRWEVRLSAVRALGKLETGAPVELLEPALDDEDGSVRAAAVHVLGNTGKRAPLHRLVAALQDPDWHVRETAVFALGKQGRRVPREVIMTALHDEDSSVREAARITLQENEAERRSPVEYGRLWEQKIMQEEQFTISNLNGKETPMLTGGEAGASWAGFAEYRGSSARSHSVREQMQEYAFEERIPPDVSSQQQVLQTAAAYQHEGEIPSRWQKATSFPAHRKSQKRWWIAIAATAIIFYLLGGITMGLVSVQVSGPALKRVEVARPAQIPGKDFQQGPGLIFAAKYAPIAQNDIANALHLSLDQIRQQLKEGKGLQDIAAAQGVSASDLQNIELKAFNDLLNAAVNAGDISQEDAKQWMMQFSSDPQLLETMTMAVLFMR